jgi:hypothetical protein
VLGVLLAGLPVLALLVGLPGGSASSRAAGSASGEPTPQTDASVPATRVTMLGASPAEANDETWGLGFEDGASALVRYTPETGWTLGPKLLDAEGKPLSGFKLDQPEAGKYNSPSPLAGQITAHGSGVIAGATGSGSSEQQMVLVRNPGGAFQATAPLPSEGEAALDKGERLLGINRAPMLAALDEAEGHAGALIVPVNEEASGEDRVLHWDGKTWTSEPIEIPADSKGESQVLAIGASSEGGTASLEDAWLIARLHGGSIALFRRHLGSSGETPSWQPVAPTPAGEPGEALTVPLQKEQVPLIVPSQDQAQLLTVTHEGVWIDGERSDTQSSATVLFKPTSSAAGEILASWCAASNDACTHELPERLPTGHDRSFAWAGSGGAFGQLVISGFADGVSLRLDGAGFTRVLALGGSARAGADVGGSYGAAFSNPKEGWLGQELLPVHLTLEPVASRLTSWPVSFRHALLALAPAPAQPVGSLASEALAVGDEGEVARFEPGKGWLPETLLGAGGRHEAPTLRAVAWPTPTRIYAIGASQNENGEPETPMWLWRGETGLWEPDPATPINFRGNLLGIAFDPNESSRGYAVGQGGVLLSYGKTWTQEATCGAGVSEPCLPAEVAQANFTSIAFAGSEAIVAYRKLIPSTERYEGGLIVNSGSGWHIDEAAATALAGGVPWAVAGLPDGGAAFTASGSEGGHVYERESAGASWQETPTPYPGNSAPGAISLFREEGALRVVAAGSVPDTAQVEDEASPPPGVPPTLIPPYPLASSQEKGVLRQTSSGWRDEEHELNNTEEPPGEYEYYDTVYQPDPVAAVMVDPSGSLGWAVGGIVEERSLAQMDTADVWRYPADGTTPLGAGTEAVNVQQPQATFAFGGGSQCAAPCADLADAKIGPDMWLSNALKEASEVSVDGIAHGVRAFFYTGPRVTTGRTAGPASLQVPYKRELGRYAQVLSTSSIPAYAATSPTDLDEAHSETSFIEAFSGFPRPFGSGSEGAGLNPTAEGQKCSGASCYYAIESSGTGGAVRVIVLDDDSGAEAEPQQEWLEAELKGAAAAGQPAIVVGDAAPQATLTGVLNTTGACASAYFYDAPEQNVELTLPGHCSIKSYGSGTLGYVSDEAQAQSDFIGSSGFLLAQVAPTRNGENVAEVTVKLIPDIGELALEAEEGTLLQRSHVDLFAGLARRPRSGNIAHNRSSTPGTDPYIPIPATCVGVECASAEKLKPAFTLTSSKPKVGNFVKQNLAEEPKGKLPELNSSGEPIQFTEQNPDRESGLFCAFNKGTTIVTISAGGLTASLPVTVEEGSVRQPCGTVPAEKTAAKEQSASVPPPAPAPSPAPTGAAPTSLASVPPVPAPVPLPASPAHTQAPQPAPPFLATQPPAAFVPAFVPLPLPTPARPTPPSGTSAVTSPVEAPEREEEQEAAPESVSNEAVAYRASEHEPAPAYILGVILLAAFAGASVRRRPRGRGREIRIATATATGARSQRHMSTRRTRHR